MEKGDNNTDNSQIVSNFTTKENVQYIGKDIRYINTKSTDVVKKSKPFYGTMGFWMGYIIPLILFIVLTILFRKQIKENANVTLMKNKRANKQAQKRLKKADAYMKEGNNDAFYEEVMKALWGYTSDKLTIPVSQLTKENIEQELVKRQVDEETIKSFKEILNTCEFARFAKSEGQSSMEEIYNQTAEVIGKLEEQVKK